MNALAEGTKVQYRKVGRAVIREHACQPERPCDATRTTTHLYEVLFETGRYRGQVREIWVQDAEEIKS